MKKRIVTTLIASWLPLLVPLVFVMHEPNLRVLYGTAYGNGTLFGSFGIVSLALLVNLNSSVIEVVTFAILGILAFMLHGSTLYAALVGIDGSGLTVAIAVAAYAGIVVYYTGRLVYFSRKSGTQWAAGGGQLHFGWGVED